jgi:hypothetical protein
MMKFVDHNEIFQKFLRDTEANSVDERLATHQAGQVLFALDALDRRLPMVEDETKFGMRWR